MNGTLVEEAPQGTGPAGLAAARPAGMDGAPDWLQERQAAAWEHFQSLPEPRRNDEFWRFADLKKTAIGHFREGGEFEAADARAAVVRSRGLAAPAARLVFGNDRLLAADGSPPAGVIATALQEGLRTHGELIRQHLLAQPTALGGDRFQALHMAALRGGAFIYVPAGLELDQPIELHQWLGGHNASVFPHVLIVAERGARVVVTDYFQSLTSEAGFACGVTDLVAGDGAQIDYICCQRWSRKVSAIHFSSTTTGRDARVKSGFIQLGAGWSRSESLCVAAGQGSHSEMLSLAIAEGQQEVDCRTRQIHRQPHTTSNLLYKNVLFDEARTIFAGLIYVEEGAHFTDAYQTCRNLLLSDAAEANSLPGLEINADQVKCSHGATSGPLRQEEVAYMRSRGIPEKAARQLLAYGFCQEVLDRIGHVEIEAAMASMVQEKFRRMQK